MLQLLCREFIVNVPQQVAWRHLTRVERWPEWAKHIKRIVVEPAGELGPDSVGVIHLNNGIKSRFRVTEFNPYRNWKWKGPFLWLTVHYDHSFQPENDDATKLIWKVEGEGFGVSLFGRIFAAIYKRDLDRAVPRLVAMIRE